MNIKIKTKDIEIEYSDDCTTISYNTVKKLNAIIETIPITNPYPTGVITTLAGTGDITKNPNIRI